MIMHINEFMRESTFKNKSIRGYGIPYNGNENTIERRFLVNSKPNKELEVCVGSISEIKAKQRENLQEVPHSCVRGQVDVV